MELTSITDPSDKWNKTVEIAVLADQLGYDSLWVYDHFHNVPRPAHETVFECWSTIAAISQRTSRIRLGQMVGCNSYRNPGLLAKITSTIDVISGGRLEWGIGAGWYENEYRAYGYEFPKPKDRIGMLRESVEIVRSMWTEAETTYKGKHYEVFRANCDPKPVQKPTPPIWIGGGGEQLTLRVVAQLADCSNFGGTPDECLFGKPKKSYLKMHPSARLVKLLKNGDRATWSVHRKKLPRKLRLTSSWAAADLFLGALIIRQHKPSNYSPQR